MTREELVSILTNLLDNRHPLTGEALGRGSCLYDPALRAELLRLTHRTAEGRERMLDREEVGYLIEELRRLAYRPKMEQVARVLTGSRSIADPRLRGLPGYRRYRGVLKQRDILQYLQRWEHLFTEDGAGEPLQEPEPAGEGTYHDVDFFDTHPFDKLEASKAEELRREVQALGLRKATERLPAYMQRARQRLPRAFEPWTREERALLIEAMCYTNDADRLAELFGRSAASLIGQGKRLIFDSRQKTAA